MKRLVVINSHPIQYFAPMYAHLSAYRDLEVTALYCSDFSLRGAIDKGFGQSVKWDIDLLSGYKSVFLRGAERRTPRGFWSLICLDIWKEVREGGYDAVWLHGYGYAAYVLAFLAAKSRGLPVLIRSETHLLLKRPSWRRKLRDAVLSLAYRFVDGFLAIGSLNRAYYQSLGVAASKIFDVPYTVDNSRFFVEAGRESPKKRGLATQLGLRADLPVILFASKLMRRKHPELVLDALEMLQRRGIFASVLIVGSGEMEPLLRVRVAERALKSVCFAGFVNQSDLPEFYAVSDIFVLPSEDEPWGLVVNEVMCAGLPVVASDEVGCAPDLIEGQGTGFVFKSRSAASLADALAILISDVDLRQKCAQRARERIAQWSYAECADGLRLALRALA